MGWIGLIFAKIVFFHGHFKKSLPLVLFLAKIRSKATLGTMEKVR